MHSSTAGDAGVRLKEIMSEVNAQFAAKKWQRLGSPQAVSAVIRRYCVRKRFPLPTYKRTGRNR